MTLASANILKKRNHWRTLEHDQRRELIVEVAMDLLDRKGVQAITMRQVAQKLGLGAMTLYTYVHGQDELCRAITKRGFDMLNSRCQNASESQQEASHKSSRTDSQNGKQAGKQNGKQNGKQDKQVDSPDAKGGNWQAGARTYVNFALENPALYHLMFSMPIKNEQADKDVITGGFAPLRECVREQMSLKGMSEKQIEQQLPMAVARFWIALHGLASLAISGRLQAYDQNLEPYIDDLLERVAPT